MKKIMMVIILVFSLFILVGCGSDTDNTNKSNNGNDVVNIKPTSDKEEVLSFLESLLTEENIKKQSDLNTIESEYNISLDIEDMASIKLGGTIELIELADTTNITTLSDLYDKVSASLLITLAGSIEAEGASQDFNDSKITGYLENGIVYANVKIDETLLALVSTLGQTAIPGELFNDQTFKLDLSTFINDEVIGSVSEMVDESYLDMINDFYSDNIEDMKEELPAFIDEAHVSISEVKDNIVTLKMEMSGETEDAFNPDVNIYIMIDMKDVVINSFTVEAMINEEVVSGSIHILSSFSKGNSIKKYDIKEEDAIDLGEILSADIFEKSPGVLTFEEFKNAEVRENVVIEGFIQAKSEWWIRDDMGYASLFLMDNDGGYFIYNLPCSLEEYYTYLQVGTKLRISGNKRTWADLVEITDITSCEVLFGSYVYSPKELTTEDFNNNVSNYVNQYFSLKGATVVPFSEFSDEDAFGYKYNGSGDPGDDIYIRVKVGDNEYYFVVETQICPAESEVYKKAQTLKIGDVIDIEGFLYWYNGPQPWLTDIVKGNGAKK